MSKDSKKELAGKLEQNILSVLNEINPSLTKKIKKEAKSAGKNLSKKWSEIQNEIEKKAKNAVKAGEKGKIRDASPKGKKSKPTQ
jgi:hypothetical protein